MATYNSFSPTANQPFYHFWLTEREGVVPPLFGTFSGKQNVYTGTAKNVKADILSGMPNLNPNYGPGGQ